MAIEIVVLVKDDAPEAEIDNMEKEISLEPITIAVYRFTPEISPGYQTMYKPTGKKP